MQILKENDQIQNSKYQTPTIKPIVLDQLNNSKTELMELDKTKGTKKRQEIDNLTELSTSTIPKPLKDLWTKSIEKPQFNRLNAQWIFKEPESIYSMIDLKKSLQRLTQIAYYQAGKIVVQTLLPLHPPVALITLDLSGITTATSADTYVPIDDHLSVQWCSFLESRLIGLYGGKASSLLLNGQHLANFSQFFASPSFTSPSVKVGDVKEGDQIKRWSDGLVQRKKSNSFQSNIGTKEIQTATRLAAAMVNKWAFFSSQSLQSINEITNKVSDDVVSNSLCHWQSQCKEAINFLLGITASPSFTEGDVKGERIFAITSPLLTSLTKHGGQTNGLFTDNFANACRSSIKSKEFVSTNSEELYNSSLQNSNAHKPLRSLESYLYFFKEKNSRKKQSSQLFSPSSSLSTFIEGDMKESDTLKSKILKKEGDVKGKRFTSPFIKLARESKNFFNPKLASNNLRVSVEDVAPQRKNVARTHAFQLINPLQFSIAQRDRFYPGWFRLYLPDIEATEFIKNIANYYFSLGLQTLTRPSLNEFTSLFFESYDIQSILSTTFLVSPSEIALIDLCENFMEYRHTENFLRPLEFSLSSHRPQRTLENKIDSHQLEKTVFCEVFNNFLEPVKPRGLKSEILKERVELVVSTPFTSPSANKGDPTTSWNFRQLEKQKIPRTNQQTNIFFHSISGDQVINNMVSLSSPSVCIEDAKNREIHVSPVENFFFCYGGNNLSIGVGLLRSAAKRRIQLHVKNQGLAKRIPKKVSYPNVSTALWGFSKPWNINRLINIGFRQEAVQYNTVNVANEIESTTCLSKKDVLFCRISKKMDRWGLKSKILKEKSWVSASGFPYLTINSENLSSFKLNILNKAVTKIGQKEISSPSVCIGDAKNEKGNENFNQFDLINSNTAKQLDVSLLFSVEKQIFSVNYNDVSIVEKELIYHSLVNNCFSKAFLLIDQNRQLTDYFADYLVRFQILRQHEILYLFSTVLFSYKKQT